LVFGPNGPRNLKQVYQFIDCSPDVSGELRDDALGALLMLARIHAAVRDECPLQVLARIPANVPLLRNWLKRHHGKQHRYSDGAIANMRSLVFKAMRAAGVKVRQGRRRVRLSEEWQQLVDLLAGFNHLLILLFPFFRWCDEEGLSVSDLGVLIFESYWRFLEEFDGRSQNPRRTYVTLVGAWEKARGAIPAWPQVPIGIVSQHDTFVLAQELFGFSAELDAMLAAAQNPDPLFPRRRKRINAITAKHQREQLLRIASAIVHATKCTPASLTSLKQLVEPTAARIALRYLTTRAYQRQLARKQQVNPEEQGLFMSDRSNDRPLVEYTQYLHLNAALLCTIARWWCAVPTEQLDELRKLATDMRPEIGLNQMAPRNREMLRKFDDRELALRVLMLPDAIYETYRHRSGFTMQEARRIERAAMVAFAIATAVRPKNHASTRIGKHLIERNGVFHVHYPASEVKNKVTLEFRLPINTTRILRFYISKVRPLLVEGESDYLWPGLNGKPKESGYLGQVIGDFMEAEVGIRITGHRFRHVAGYLFLLDNPNGYEVVRLLLGHKSLKTTMTFYASLEVKEGYKRYDAFLKRRRDELFGKHGDDQDGGDHD
jgi:integrase